MSDKEKDIEQLIYRELPPDRYCYIHNYIVDLKNQLQQKESIIKEVREYMKTLSDEYAKDDYDIKCDVFNKLYYEILDKEVN